MTTDDRVRMRSWRTLSLFAALTMVAALLPATALATAGGSITTTLSPTVIAAQGSQTLTLTITPTGNTLRWVGVIAPTGYTIGAISATGATDSATDTVNYPQRATITSSSGWTSAVAITLTVTPANGCTTSADTWSVYGESEYGVARLDIGAFPDEDPGATLDGDDFTPYPAQPTTTLQNDCHLAFLNEPTDTVKTQPITDVALSAGAPIAVLVEDDSDNPVAISGASVTLAASGGPATLAGTTIVPTDSSGQASFSGISLSQDGTYTLGATAPTMAAATSSPFDIVDAGASCTSGSGCAANATGGTNGSTGLGVTGASSGNSGVLTIAFTGNLTCSLPIVGTTYKPTSAIFTVDLTTDATKIFDLTISRAAAKAARKPFAFQYHVCFNAPLPFRQLLGAQAKADATNGGFTGLLPGCLTVLSDDIPSLPKAGSGPCVEWKYNDLQGNIHIRFFAPAGDPRGYS